VKDSSIRGELVRSCGLSDLGDGVAYSSSISKFNGGYGQD
jgi:hypothetical protein